MSGGGVWRPVDGWPYEVSNAGKVRNVRSGHVLVPSKHNLGYRTVTLCHGGERSSMYVHHVVLNTFVGTRLDGMECNHKNGDKADNRLDNLEWVTNGENMRHAADHGLIPRGEGHRKAKLTESDVRDIRRLAACGRTPTHLAARFPVTRRHIRDIVRMRSWRHVT